MALPKYQQRTAQATKSGQLGAAEAQAVTFTPPGEVLEALGFWDECGQISKLKIGEVIDAARKQSPQIPWAEIGAALGVSPDAARQRWKYYLDSLSH